jgi:hypothetical protein
MIRSTFSIPAMIIAQKGVYGTITQTKSGSLVLNEKKEMNRDYVLSAGRLVGIKLALV